MVAATVNRCHAVVKLKDGTTADCMRRAVAHGVCRQHAALCASGGVITLDTWEARIEVSPVALTMLVRRRPSHDPFAPICRLPLRPATAGHAWALALGYVTDTVVKLTVVAVRK